MTSSLADRVMQSRLSHANAMFNKARMFERVGMPADTVKRIHDEGVELLAAANRLAHIMRNQQ